LVGFGQKKELKCLLICYGIKYKNMLSIKNTKDLNQLFEMSDAKKLVLLINTEIDDDFMPLLRTHLSNLTNLVSIHISFNRGTKTLNFDCDIFKYCINVRSLTICANSSNIDLYGLQYLKKLHKLTIFVSRHLQSKLLNIRYLKNCISLKEFSAREFQLNLEELPEQLNTIICKDVTDIKTLAKFKKLKRFVLKTTNRSDYVAPLSVWESVCGRKFVVSGIAKTQYNEYYNNIYNMLRSPEPQIVTELFVGLKIHQTFLRSMEFFLKYGVMCKKSIDYV
jgi:hypothetical protein